MLLRWQFLVLLCLSVAFALLTAYNMYAFSDNRAIQREIATGQQMVQRNNQLEGLANEIVKALAELSVRDNDADLRNLLAANGITVNYQPPAEVPAADSDGGDKP